MGPLALVISCKALTAKQSDSTPLTRNAQCTILPCTKATQALVAQPSPGSTVYARLAEKSSFHYVVAKNSGYTAPAGCTESLCTEATQGFKAARRKLHSDGTAALQDATHLAGRA